MVAYYHLVWVEAGSPYLIFAKITFDGGMLMLSVGYGMSCGVSVDTQLQAECLYPLSVPAAPFQLLGQEGTIFVVLIGSYGVFGLQVPLLPIRGYR